MSEKLEILLVEDDEDDALFARRMLDASHLDCTLTWVDDYDAAINALAGKRFDVCLLDYRLAGRNGIDLLREQGARNADTSMIMLTSHLDETLDVEAMKAGAEDYLVKTALDTRTLERSIRYAIERRRARELHVRMGRIMDASVNEIYTLDAHSFRVLQTNAGVRANLGYSRTELEQLDLDALLREAGGTEGWLDALRRGEYREAVFEGWHKRKDGSEYPVEAHLQRFDDERPPVFLVTALDISARRESENRMQRAQKMEAVGQLAGGLAHDFNNLLTVVCGNLEMLRMGRSGWDAAELVDDAHAAAQRGADLTRRLLTFSRRQALEPHVVDPTALVSAMVRLLNRTLGPGVRVETNMAPELWNVLVDQAQLENAILNLALNARDAMPDGGTLRIDVDNHTLQPCAGQRRPQALREFVRFRITDSGEGISPEHLKRVCEPFFTTKEAGRGSGLGLSMVYGFVQQSNAILDIHSELGHGTTVTMQFPRSQAPAERPAVRPTPPEEAHKGLATLLVVEDDEAVRRMANRVLSELGYTVAEAATGDRALEMLENGLECDLLFTDLFMPGEISGLALAERAREILPGLPVVITSGYREKFQSELPAGAVFVAKPYSTTDLAECVARTLESRPH